jgi:hypothetical protein
MRLAEAEAPKWGHVLLEDMVAQIALADAKRLVAALTIDPSLGGRLERRTGELLRHALEVRFGDAIRDVSAPAPTAQGKPPSQASPPTGSTLPPPPGNPPAQPAANAQASKAQAKRVGPLVPPAIGRAPKAQAKRMSLLGRVWILLEATARTVFATLLRPLAWALAIAVLVWLSAMLLFGQTEFTRAFSDRSVHPLVSGSSAAWASTATAFGVAVMALRGLSTFLFSSRTFLSRNLGRHLPRDEALLRLIPIKTLRFYHDILRYAGALAFASELVLQLFAIALVSWSVALHSPLQLFVQPEASFLDVQLFWLNQMFTLVDGPNTFGTTLSPLEANRELWLFGVVILTFRFLIIGLIVRLFLDSINLQPRDISEAWGAALDRSTAVGDVRVS